MPECAILPFIIDSLVNLCIYCGMEHIYILDIVMDTHTERLDQFEHEFADYSTTEIYYDTLGLFELFQEKLGEERGARLARHLLFEDMGFPPYELPDNSIPEPNEEQCKEFPIYSDVRTVYAYAFYGIFVFEQEDDRYDDDISSEQNDADLRKALSDRVFHSAKSLSRYTGISRQNMPKDFSPKEEADFNHLYLACWARAKVDQSDFAQWDPLITPVELSALVSVGTKSLKNLMAPSKGIIKTTREGTISPEEAKRWLSTRADFLPTIFSTEETEQVPEGKSGTATLIDEEIAFVPTAADGSWFGPHCERDGQFIIFNPQEHTATSFEEALTILSHQVTPQWRRPTPGGRWTKVSAVHWERKLASELTDQKEPS